MKKLGNIVTDSNYDFGVKYNIVNDKANIIEGIPTIVFGWKIAKEEFGANILRPKISDGLFWGFSNKEKRNRFNESFAFFERYCTKHLLSFVKYNFINLITISDDERRLLSSKPKSSKQIKAYIDGDMVYFCFDDEQTVYGISLLDADYRGLDRNRIMLYLFPKEKTKKISNSDVIDNGLNSIFKEKKYLIPYMA